MRLTTEDSTNILYLGAVFPNGQIIHQVPFGSVLQATQPDATMQLSHRPPDFKVMHTFDATADL